MEFWKSATTEPPREQGWYAVLICFDPQEGVFPGGAYWKGHEWGRKAVVMFGGDSLESEKAAEELAEQNGQEPVAEVDWLGLVQWCKRPPPQGTKLYALPVAPVAPVADKSRDQLQQHIARLTGTHCDRGDETVTALDLTAPVADKDAERWRTYLKVYADEGMCAAEWDGPEAMTAYVDAAMAKGE